LLRLRTFVDWHVARGRQVVVKPPRRIEVRRYMVSMHLHHGAPDGTYEGLPSIRERDRSEALLPVSVVKGAHEADHLSDDLIPILEEFAEVPALPQAVNMAMAELANNAVEHGQNEFGAYLAVQRYPKAGQLIIATSDLGIGIPEHVRQQHPEWTSDGD